MRVGIIGCGKIADSHAAQILRIPGSRIVGVCDREELMARQLAERFPVDRCYGDLERFLNEARPEVVHITTPPQGHHDLARTCLDAGCHVYLEKPFTVTAEETEDLIRRAAGKGLKITAGHDDQFMPAARKMRELVRQGYLGGPPVHLESWYCYDLGDERYARALLGDRNHWVRNLPGTLMQNNISHGISRIAEFLPDDDVAVTARGFVSPLLRNMDETGIVDEARVMIDNGKDLTAYFTFSTQMRPALRLFRIYGRKNGIELDHHRQTAIRLEGAVYKSYLEKFLPPLELAAQYAGGAFGNLRRFLRNDFHMKSGMKYLIESFYRAIAEDGPPPIPYREIVLTGRIMDSIFAQIGRRQDGGRAAAEKVSGRFDVSGAGPRVPEQGIGGVPAPGAGTGGASC